MNRKTRAVSVPVSSVFILVFSAVILGLSGCATSHQTDFVSPEFQPDTVEEVAVLPFRNLAGYPKAGEIMTDLMTTELQASPEFAVLPGPRVQEIAREIEFDRDRVSDLDYLQNVAEELDTRYLVTGSVTEYRYKQGLGEEPVAGVNARLVDTENGQVLWSASHSSGGQYFWTSTDSLNRLAQHIISDMVEELATA